MTRHRFIPILVCATALTACTPAELATVKTDLKAIEVQAIDDGQEFCQVGEEVIPFVQAGAAIAATVIPSAGSVVALDQTTVSPVLNAACKAVDGIVVAPVKPAVVATPAAS